MDRVGRALEQLAEFGGRGVFFQLALRAIKLYRIETQRIHFDTTTVTFSGEYQGSKTEPRITHGHNKDHRPDLKQLLFGLNVTSDGAVPVLHGVWSGNQSDDTLHRGNFDALRDLLQKSDFVYVADCKLCNDDAMNHAATPATTAGTMISAASSGLPTRAGVLSRFTFGAGAARVASTTVYA